MRLTAMPPVPSSSGRASAGQRPVPVRWARSLARRAGVKRGYNAVRAVWVRRQPPRAVWERNLPGEVAFWRRELPERIAEMADYQNRADPDGPVTDQAIIRCLDRIADDTVSIVDVGSGPLTAVGATHPGKRLIVTAVDPLADEYARDMERAGIQAPVVPVASAGEELLSHFAPESFDIAYARNSLDHGFDPVRTIENMVALVKPGRFVVLRHLPSEARRRAYRDLHQWNFDLRGDDFVVWRTRGALVNVTQLLRDRATVECGYWGHWLVTTITKHPRHHAFAPPSGGAAPLHP